MKIESHWKALREFIDTKKRLLITTHVHPDGDAIGSQVALAEYVRRKEKKVFLINCDVTPKYFQFLDPDNKIELFSGERHNDLFATFDGCLIVDISDWARLRRVGTLIREYRLPVACIDHHIPTDDMGDVNINFQQASSTGELLYDFFCSGEEEMTQEMVDALYTCVLTDTGSFRYSNTTPRTHVIAADLLRRGAQFRRIFEEVYENYSGNRTKLMGYLLENMQFACNDRLAYFSLTQALLQQTGTELWETEGFSELARSIEGVELSLMFTETSDGRTKVSFRSKGHIPINGLANKFGGGGHKYASGALMDLALPQAIKVVLEEAKKIFTESIHV